ncbi:hypothetical protein EBZ39_03515 [bacterium]|nr:hypothetical protein [bacterium]
MDCLLDCLLDCLSAYQKWRDEKIASGVRYAIESIRRNDRFFSESSFPASENAGIAENQS